MKTESAVSVPDPVCPCGDSCPLGKALAVIGGKWKLRIICTLYVDGTETTKCHAYVKADGTVRIVPVGFRFTIR